jgi:hypothetical protein
MNRTRFYRNGWEEALQVEAIIHLTTVRHSHTHWKVKMKCRLIDDFVNCSIHPESIRSEEEGREGGRRLTPPITSPKLRPIDQKDQILKNANSGSTVDRVPVMSHLSARIRPYLTAAHQPGMRSHAVQGMYSSLAHQWPSF